MIITFKTQAHPDSTQNYALSVSGVSIHDNILDGIGFLYSVFGSSINFKHIEISQKSGDYFWSYRKTSGQGIYQFSYYYWLVDLNNFEIYRDTFNLNEYANESILKAKEIAIRTQRNKKIEEVIE